MAQGAEASPSSADAGAPAVRVAVGPDLAPGENIRDDVTGATWSYVLPNRRLGIILSLGRPTAWTEATLRQLGAELIVARPGRRRRLSVPAFESRPRSLREVAPTADSRWPLADRSVSLVVIVDPRWSRRLARDPDLAADLVRILATDGSVFADFGRAATSNRVAPWPALFGARDLLWLAARAGEVRAVVPAADRPRIDFVVARWNHDREARSRVGRIARRLREGGIDERLGALHLPGIPGDLERPPAYLREAAAAGGSSIDHHRWALIDPGSYSTKKLLLFLFREDQAKPEYVVKLVRDRRFNARLENAWRALSDLERRSADLRRAAPRPAFFGRHAGLAFMAETVVEGEPLRRRLSGEPDDPIVRAVVEWFIEIGRATADPSIATPAGIASDLRDMLDRFGLIYRPPRSDLDFLAARIDALAGAGSTLPLVLQHGDAGPWNVLAGRDGPILIDWEAALPHGMPLWDVFYFLRSIGVGNARRQGIRDPTAAFERNFLGLSPLGGLLIEATEKYCAQAGIARDLVEPLFYTCWMHRALKESSTLQPARLASGRFLNLLRRCIEEREAPGLRRLFGGVMPGH